MDISKSFAVDRCPADVHIAVFSGVHVGFTSLFGALVPAVSRMSLSTQLTLRTALPCLITLCLPTSVEYSVSENSCIISSDYVIAMSSGSTKDFHKTACCI